MSSSRTTPAATSGEAATAPAHDRASGHAGPASASDGRDRGEVDAHRPATAPPRTASATASSTRSSVSPPRSPSRAATWTSAASRTPAALNAPSSPSAPAARRRSWSGPRLDDRADHGAPSRRAGRRRPRAAPPAAATRTRRTARRRPAGSRGRTCRAGRGRARRRGAARGRSRAAASAGTGAAPRRTAAPAAGSRSGPSRRRAPRAGRRARSAARRAGRASWSCSRRPGSVGSAVEPQPEHDVDRPGEVAAQALLAERRDGEGVGVRRGPGRRRAGAGAAAARGRQPDVAGRRAGEVAPGQRQLEVELAQPVAPRDLGAGWRHRRPGRAGESQTATSASASSLAVEVDRPPHQLLVDVGRAASARRSGAPGSACSRTACTSEPKVAPTGSPAIGDDRRWRPASAGAGGSSATSSSSFGGHLRLAAERRRTPRHLDVAEGGVRRAAPGRCRPHGRSGGRRGPPTSGRRGSVARVGPADSSGTGPPRSRQAPKRPTTSSSVGTGGVAGTVGSPAARISSRCSGEATAFLVGAHQHTTWDWARVIATYSRRSHSPASSSVQRRTWSPQSAPPPPTSRQRRPFGVVEQRTLRLRDVPVGEGRQVDHGVLAGPCSRGSSPAAPRRRRSRGGGCARRRGRRDPRPPGRAATRAARPGRDARSARPRAAPRRCGAGR